MLSWILRLFATLTSSGRKAHKLADAALESNGQPLLDALLNGEISWIKSVYSAVSTDGTLKVKDDIYFYLQICGHSVEDLNLSRLMIERLECAAVNSAGIAKALSDSQVIERHAPWPAKVSSTSVGGESA